MLIYLDSQDYSRLSDPRRSEEQSNIDLRLKLEEAAQSGLHAFPFSNLHVQEAVHDGASNRELALGRAILMKRIARGQTFAPFEHMLIREVYNASMVAALGVKKAANEIQLIRTDSVWWPWETFVGQGPLDIRAEVLAKLDTDTGLLGRQERRNYEKARKAMEKGIEAQVDEQIPRIAAWLVENFPASPRMTNRTFLRSFILGEIDQAIFYDELMTQALDVETFVGWAVDKYASARGVASYVKASGYELANKIQTALDAFPVSKLLVLPEPAQKELNLIRERGISNATRAFKKGMIEAGVKLLSERGLFRDSQSADAAIDFLVEGNEAELPGIEVVHRCFEVWLKLISAPTEQRQKVLRSDVLDMLHAIYLPYVDCFRADARFANIVRQSGCQHLEKLESVPAKLLQRLA